jgi:hypothetical protein
MAIEHILGLVTFVVIVLTLSLLLPIKQRPSGRYDGGDGGSTGWTGDRGGDCGGGDGGGD